MLVKLVASSSVLVAALFASGCGDGMPSAPSPARSPVAATPDPGPAPDTSRLEGEWNVTVRLTAVSGTGCIADTMRSQIGVASNYSLSVVKKGGLMVTLKSASGDYACTFKPVADNSGFTTYGQRGYYTCEQFVLAYRCNDGTAHGIFSFGEDISGRLTGNEMSGAWDAVWFEGDDTHGVEMKTQFTGTRQ